jgi:Protein of unknown function (DUF3099)
MAHAGEVTRHDEPLLVTTAAKSPVVERRERERRYLFTMALRVVCFVAAIVLFAVGPRWAGLLAAAGSLVLPWVAVVAANAAPKRTSGTPALYARERPQELPPGD